MKKVLQKTVDSEIGDCMQATVASLFDMELDDVPKFIELDPIEFHNFFRDKGYDYTLIDRKEKRGTEELREIAKFDGGINGYFYGVVESQTFEGKTHAVVIDSDLNIVHDPNPNQKSLKLSPDDVLQIMCPNGVVIKQTGEIVTLADWRSDNENRRNNSFRNVLNMWKGNVERFFRQASFRS